MLSSIPLLVGIACSDSKTVSSDGKLDKRISRFFKYEIVVLCVTVVSQLVAPNLGNFSGDNIIMLIKTS